MKMEIPIGPAVDGTIEKIHVSAGELIGALAREAGPRLLSY